MPLIPLLKLIFGLLSLFILAMAVWLLRTWWDGYLIPAEDGAGLVSVRDAWRLVTGLGLLAFSLLGRPIDSMLLAKNDTDPSVPRREEGSFIGGVEASLYVERRGAESGLPLILTHGWGLDSTVGDYASRALGDRHPLIVWDLPGLGRSKVKPKGVALPAFLIDGVNHTGFLAGGQLPPRHRDLRRRPPRSREPATARPRGHRRADLTLASPLSRSGG